MTNPVIGLVLFALLVGLAAWLLARREAEQAEARRHAERIRIRRAQCDAQARISRLTTQALHDMAAAASSHGVLCRCTHCTEKGDTSL
ncbi:MAG: hypothetical protein QM809_17215 [Gordonia sp. (in: high G+C Gram-positive bacteria)]|uniref:hypothetical protein n=1 Tax=Gordonia sp. (in: high G+C Gram-positive bacteria) TaxID=84139 RepID=UPI0039E369EE